jgi:alpha-beta hydrolase superfamily lysophospholipase
VTCPVLALYGDSDQLNDVRQATDNHRDGLAHSGSRDFTVKVFPSASHSLMEVPSGNRMAPGVFDTLRSWLRQRVGSTASQN